jgi:hypothetical protein
VPLIFQKPNVCLDLGDASPHVVDVFLNFFVVVLCLSQEVDLYTEFLFELGLLVRQPVHGNKHRHFPLPGLVKWLYAK